MQITYSDTRDFDSGAIGDLLLSVGRPSGR